MWYVKSGALQGISGKPTWDAAFIELFDAHRAQTGHWPDLGTLGAASNQGFNFNPQNTTFFLTEWTLFANKRIPKMSHGFNNPQEQMVSLFSGLPNLSAALELINHGESEIFDDDLLDAPNSGTWLDKWPDVIDVPDDHKWPETTADGDASLLGT